MEPPALRGGRVFVKGFADQGMGEAIDLARGRCDDADRSRLAHQLRERVSG
jgi:hypothetical protein